MKISRRKFFSKSFRFLAASIPAIIGVVAVRNLDIPYPKAPPYFAKIGETKTFGWYPLDTDADVILDGITEVDCVKGYAHQIVYDSKGAPTGEQRLIHGNFKLVKMTIS